MDSVMPLLINAMTVAVLVVYALMVLAAGWALAWFLWHVLHDHWSMTQTWRVGRDRLLGRAH